MSGNADTSPASGGSVVAIPEDSAGRTEDGDPKDDQRQTADARELAPVFTSGNDGVPDAQATEAMFEAMAALDADEAAALRERWGEDAAANLGLAMSVSRDFTSPALAAFLEESGMGDHPALVEAAATIGRRLAELTSAAEATAACGGDGVSPSEPQNGALDQQIEALTAQIHDAAQRSDLRLVDRLSQRRDALAERLWGGRPIIGREQRTL